MLTVKEASEFLKIHPEMIRNYIRLGKLRATKDKLRRGRGGTWLIQKKDLVDFRSDNLCHN